MPDATLQKALKGDFRSLIQMTELIQSNQLSSKVLHELTTESSSINPHRDYLKATYLYFNKKSDADLNKAKHLLKRHAADGNGFAKNMLYLVYKQIAVGIDSVDRHREKILSNLNEAGRLGNPLAILNIFAENIQVNDSESALLRQLPMIAGIMNQLTPGYKEGCMNKIVDLEKSIKSPAGLYELARFYEKIGAKNEMYRAFHQAIAEDKGSKYIRKLVKAMDRTVNRNLFFKTTLDADFIKGYLDFLKETVEKIEDKMEQPTVAEKEDLAEEMYGFNLRLRSVTYLATEKASEFSPQAYQSINRKIDDLTKTSQFIMDKLASLTVKPDGI